MARRLRIQDEGALFHVLNRGNYRGDVFESDRAKQAFVAVMEEACFRYGNQRHLDAYVVMRNHFHLALRTPGANLVDWMYFPFGCSDFGEESHLRFGMGKAGVINRIAMAKDAGLRIYVKDPDQAVLRGLPHGTIQIEKDRKKIHVCFMPSSS